MGITRGEARKEHHYTIIEHHLTIFRITSDYHQRHTSITRSAREEACRGSALRLSAGDAQMSRQSGLTARHRGKRRWRNGVLYDQLDHFGRQNRQYTNSQLSVRWLRAVDVPFDVANRSGRNCYPRSCRYPVV